MADTALSIITDAFKQMKVYSPGVTLGDADAEQGLTTMNEMLDEWSNTPYACFANLEQAIPLVPGKNSYTIGTSGGADINAVRPIAVLPGRGSAFLVDVNNNRYPVDVIQQDQWNVIGLLTTQSSIPDTLFYDPQFPLGILNIYPTPSTAYNLFFDARLQLANLANLNAAFSLPPGYRAAVKNNLCVRLWPYYKQGDPSAILIDLATKSLADVKRTNIKMSPSPYDSAVISKAKSSYNIYNDGTSRRG